MITGFARLDFVSTLLALANRLALTGRFGLFGRFALTDMPVVFNILTIVCVSAPADMSVFADKLGRDDITITSIVRTYGCMRQIAATELIGRNSC